MKSKRQWSAPAQAAEHAGLDGAHEALDVGFCRLWRVVEGRVVATQCAIKSAIGPYGSAGSVGLGIDEATAVVVQGSKLTVLGESKVAVIDRRGGGTGEPVWLAAGAEHELAPGR